jgi:hypothetical protein
MGKAGIKKSKAQLDGGKNFPNAGLDREIEQLKTAAVKAQQIVDKSHKALYQVLTDCLVLVVFPRKSGPPL